MGLQVHLTQYEQSFGSVTFIHPEGGRCVSSEPTLRHPRLAWNLVLARMCRPPRRDSRVKRGNDEHGLYGQAISNTA